MVFPVAGSDVAGKLVAIGCDRGFLDFLAEALAGTPLEIIAPVDPQEALKMASDEATDIVLLDTSLPQWNDSELLRKIPKKSPRTQVLLLTSQYSREASLEAGEIGASDYLDKSLSAESLRQRLIKLVSAARGRQKAEQTADEPLEAFRFEGIVGCSPSMLEVFDQIRRVASHFRNILVSGATGTGKELVARALHRLGPGAAGPFVICSCATLVETLLDSDLLGNVKGPFKEAMEDRQGYFELAHRGTLFLDGIGDLSLPSQARLLRVLQDHVVQRLGSPQLHEVDVRVVASTNRDLRAMVSDGKFREDLYFRISAIEINLPAISRRMGDLPLLERYFVKRYATQYNKQLRGISRRAQIVLAQREWAGNVRELENVLAYACMMAQGDVIEVQDLPSELFNRESSLGDETEKLCSLEDLQRRHIQRVLKIVKYNKGRAAEILGIGRTTLYRLLHREVQR